MKGKIFIITLFLITLFNLKTYADERYIDIVYFYAPSCSACKDVSIFIEEVKNSNKDVRLIKHDILEPEINKLFIKYNESYNVTDEEKMIVPMVFIRDKYLKGEEKIKEDLLKIIGAGSDIQTRILKIEETNRNISILILFLVGFINGFNPCALTMFLYFLSIISAKGSEMLRGIILYIVGKFLTYLFLGILINNLLLSSNLFWVKDFTKILLILFMVILIILNIYDYIFANKENYKKMKLQLPDKLQKINYGLIRKCVEVSNLKLVLPLSFLVGIITSLGEFICTGQIYLTTIVAVPFITGIFEWSISSFIIYSGIFLIPLILLGMMICKGKEIYILAEFVRDRIKIVKIINVILFMVLAILVLSRG